MEKMYVDQAGWEHGVVSSCYLPEGVRRMDTLFANRIMAFGKGESFTQRNWRGDVEWVWVDTEESIRRDINENPHLHPEIKKNLLYNLYHQ
jgi:hypothetical protein